jgi:ankyrin repeat protein
VFGVFFLASFSHFVRAEIAKNPQESVRLPSSASYDGLKDLVNLHTPGTAIGNYTEKNLFPDECKTQKLKESSREIQKAWHNCTHMLMRSCSEDSKVYQDVLEQYPSLIYVVDDNGRNLLMNAVRLNNEALAALLVPYYANAQLLNAKDVYGDSALFTAIQNQNKYAVALLLFHGAKTDIRNSEDFNAVQFSCTLESLEMFYFIKGTLEKLDELRTQKKESDLTKTMYN